MSSMPGMSSTIAFRFVVICPDMSDCDLSGFGWICQVVYKPVHNGTNQDRTNLGRMGHFARPVCVGMWWFVYEDIVVQIGQPDREQSDISGWDKSG